MKTESGAGGRVAMLGRIRAALGRDGEAPRPQPPAPYVSPAKVDAERATLVELFRRAAEAANIIVADAQTEADVENYLDSLVLRDACRVVASSDGVAASHGGLVRRLSEKGLSVVVPPAETSAQTTAAGADEDFKAALFKAGVGVTAADYAIAETGTLVLVSGGERHRLISLLPPVHVCLLDTRLIVGSMGELLAHFREHGEAHGRLPQALTLITGPSRTADVEQTLALGVHGPHELHVLLRTL